MKKYVLAIILIGLVLASFLTYSVLKIQEDNRKIFEDSGYILQGMSEQGEAQNVERYYFNANEEYKKSYNSQYVFNNTNGEEVVTDEANFVHYSSGSIAALKDGVLLELSQIDRDPISYYNIAALRTLEKKQDVYTISNLGNELEFQNFIWKISETKFLIVGTSIRIVFADGSDRVIEDGYVELEYVDNEVIKIYNQEITYQTVSSDVYIEMPDNVRINLGNKIVSKNDENEMSLLNMVINSDDNITIADLSEEEETNNTTENETTNNTAVADGGNGQTSSSSSQTTNNNDQTVINGGATSGQDQIINSGSNSGTDTSIDIDNSSDNALAINEPKFTIEDFETNALGITASIVVDDQDALLTDDTHIRILDNTTGRVVYETTESLGVYDIDIEVATLSPDTNYTLEVESSYSVDGINYTKNFIYKIFRTSDIGIDLRKDVFTDSSLSFFVDFTGETQARSAEISIENANGDNLGTQTVTIQDNQVEFTGLDSNQEYTIRIINVLYDGQIISNGLDLSEKHTTLKTKPTISGPEYEIDKRNGKFILRIKNVEDTDGGIQKYRFEVYDTRNEGENNEPVKTIETTNKEVELPIDDSVILRQVGYYFKVVAEFYDNEKIYEYESENSNIMKMDGVEFPTVRFEEKEITYERIQGTLVVEDSGNTIDMTQETIFTIIYTDSVGNARTFKSQPNEKSLRIPVDVNNLRANETYRFEVYANVDLQDGNEAIEQCYIGGAIVQTGNPQNMVAEFNKVATDVTTPFNIEFQLTPENEDQGTLEPETLTGLTFTIYAGQTTDGQVPSGTPLRTIRAVDSNTKPYESELKTQYYDNKASITPAFFGAQNSDFKDKYYTIVVSDAYDYTDYQNELPIMKNVFTVDTNGYMPDLPSDVDNALDVTVIRDRDAETPRDDLDDTTVVGYKVKAKYDNSGMYAKTITYKIYDADTEQLIQTKEVSVGADGLIPEVTFDIGDGTPTDTNDLTEPKRGHRYYFTYEAMLDLNGDGSAETKYPYNDGEEETVLKSNTVTAEKQAPQIVMYQTKSDSNTATFKYKCADVDNALENDEFVAYIGDNWTGTKTITSIGSEDFQEVTFDNLTVGDFEIRIEQRLLKSNAPVTINLIEQYFEGVNQVNNVKYEVSLDSNRVLITLIDSNGQLNKIAAVKVELEAVDGSAKVVADLRKPNNNIVGIDLNDLGELLKKETKVKVTGYYDSGITGYELEADHYIALQKSHLSNEEKFYYGFNRDGNLVENPSIVGNIYESTRTDNIMTIRNALNTTQTKELELQYSPNGFMYEYNKLLPKQINTQELQCEGSDIIEFNRIIPGISLMDNEGNLNILSQLTSVEFNAELIANEIGNDHIITIELYETDENGSGQTLVNSYDKKVSDFNSTIELTDLVPKTYYFLKFKTKLPTEDGLGEEDKYLYDIDDQIEGKNYYFSTLADVGISNIEVVYNPVKYNNKTVDIKYHLDRIMGYDKIKYVLQEYDEDEAQYKDIEDYTITDDTLFLNEMTKKLEANPGSIFKFGVKYKIQIIPIAIIEDFDGSQEELEVGRREQEFILDTLAEPTIAIKGSRTQDNSVQFRVTVYDNDRIVQNDKYKIKIYDNTMKDITPEEYKDKEYDTDIINNTFTISNADSKTRYTIEVTTMLDYDNDAEELYEHKKTYSVEPINEYGISLGTVSARANSTQPDKVEIVFNNSYKLTDIEKVRYSIYNTNGFSQSGEEDFIPVRVGLEDETYTYGIDQSLETAGTYYIELQFIKENTVVENITVEYVYIQQ